MSENINGWGLFRNFMSSCFTSVSDGMLVRFISHSTLFLSPRSLVMPILLLLGVDA